MTGDKLLERLREMETDYFGHMPAKYCGEAADEITRLRAELEQVKKERDFERAEAAMAKESEKCAREWQEAAEARVERLRHTLTVIAETAEEDWNDWVKNGYEATEPIGFAEGIFKLARAALKETAE